MLSRLFPCSPASALPCRAKDATGGAWPLSPHLPVHRPSVEVHALRLDSVKGIELCNQLLHLLLFSAGLQQNHTVVGAIALSGIMQSHTQLNLTPVFGQNFLQFGRIRVAVAHTDSNDIKTPIGNTPFVLCL